MAKVVMPLGGIEARGKIADTFVYFPWKGINAVRSYVIPANPNTAAQQAQRTKLTDAVADYHSNNHTDADVTALRRWASIQATPMTQFNVFVKAHIAVEIAGDTWIKIRNGLITSASSGVMKLVITGVATRVYKCRFGYSPTFMPDIVTCTTNDTTGRDCDKSGMTSGAIGYCQPYVDEAGYGATGGIFRIKIT